MRTALMIAAVMLLMLGTAFAITVVLAVDMLESDAALMALFVNSLLLLDLTFLIFPAIMIYFLLPIKRNRLKNGGIADVQQGVQTETASIIRVHKSIQEHTHHLVQASERLQLCSEQLTLAGKQIEMRTAELSQLAHLTDSAHCKNCLDKQEKQLANYNDDVPRMNDPISTTTMSNRTFVAAAMEQQTACVPEEISVAVATAPATFEVDQEHPLESGLQRAAQSNGRDAYEYGRYANLNNREWGCDVQILAVDGEVHQLHAISSYLQPLGWTITTALSGADALRLIEQNRFDLVLLDSSLPGSFVSGNEMCVQLRQSYSPEELPIIMMMSMCVPEEIIQCFKSGANDYLPKPFIGQELIARIEARLRLRRLELRSKSILSKVEVEVLRYYSSNPGASRRAIVELMNHDREHPIAEKTLANHITSILRKTTCSRMYEAVAVAKRNSWI
ncbi:hypothetical protein PCCS19_00460 [Paenibacillus sp. CCS19]|nr:hypothetical protein PCCS19_00460 [Paenibacillus cellulosilyticus]